MGKILTIVFFLSCIGFGYSQSKAFPFASKKSRELLVSKLHDSIINPQAEAYLKLNTPINWSNYAWATAFVIDDSNQNKNVLQKALHHYQSLSKPDLQKVFESVFACFPKEFVPEITQIANTETQNEKIFATAVHYLAQNNQAVASLLKTKFTHSNSPIIQALHNHFLENYNPISFADLKGLIESNSSKNTKFLYSIQHQNRDKIGRVFIQEKNGQLAKKDGQVLLIDQLARSATNLPMYISNGNTPTGVYKIDTLATSENKFIGPTLSFVTYLPFECEAKSFYNDHSTEFTVQKYLEFFPKEIQKNTLLQQSFWAGKAGRTEIHFHGTTIDQNLYIGKDFFSQTPSMGCLCSSETYDDQGVRISSDQETLVKAWLATPNQKGYAYVLELQESDWNLFEKKLNKLIEQ